MKYSVIKTIENAIVSSWDKPALSDFGTDVRYTYGDVAKHIAHIHLRFEELGIQPRDKVALCDKNGSNWAICMLAIITYGTVAVPLLPDYSEKQIKDLCEHSESKLLIGNPKLMSLWEKGKAPLKLMETSKMLYNEEVQTDEHEKLLHEAFLKRYANGFDKEHLTYNIENPDDLMLLSYTSGSTGNPKGVMLTYRSLWSNADYMREIIPFPANPDFMVILPMAHMFGLAFDMIASFMVCAHIHFITQAPTPKILMAALQEIKPFILLAVPLVMEKIIKGKVLPLMQQPKMKFLLSIPLLRDIIYKKIRTQLLTALGGNIYSVVMGGAALNKEVENVLKTIKFPFTVGYGMTECGPLIAYADWKLFKKGSCGRVVPRMEARILSKDGANIPGEIVVRGENVMLGYYKNEEATREAIDEEGWLHTGDLGVMDSDNFLFIRGRQKNMLLGSNGQNIYPEEAEDQITTHTIFDECVVVQRETRLVALVYVSDLTLKANQLTLEQVKNELNTYKAEVNKYLPKYCQIHQFELQNEEFQKTPKKSIKRYLYS